MTTEIIIGIVIGIIIGIVVTLIAEVCVLAYFIHGD